MNNFEKRLFVDYLDKLLPALNEKSYDFNCMFDLFLKEFKISKSIFKSGEDGVVLAEIISQRFALKRKLRVVLKELKEKLPIKKTQLETKLNIIKDIYRLEEDEFQTFVFIIMPKISTIFDNLTESINGTGIEVFFKHYFNSNCMQMREMQNKLYMKNIFINRSSHPEINTDILRIFENPSCNSIEKITQTLIGEPEKSTLTLNDFSHIEKESNKVISILKNAVKKKVKGINILFYGSVGTGKTELSKLVANCSSIPIYSVTTVDENQNEASRAERLNDLCSKQHLLSRDGNFCILFDEAEDVLNRDFRSNEVFSKGYMNKLLETTPVPIIWTTNNIYDVDPAFLRRMTYCIEFEKLSENARLNIWNKVLEKNKLKVSKEKVEELNKSYNIPPSIIANAIQTTKMIGGGVDDFEDLIENVARVVTKKKVVKENKDSKLNNYDINLINTDIDISNLTQKIQQSGKLNFSLCLYGEPGTGKSNYVRYLADQLGIEVLLKRASDLISPYVGQTEQNIAEAFVEAKSKKAMLIFDEADTFLQDRHNAVRNWEVAQVNEMLTQMEAAEYPFACTTNLLDSLDEASLRRFTFKIKFDFLTIEQVNLAMEHFFGIKSTKTNIKGLTAGDFATVKKKVDFLNITNEKEIIKMLEDEVKIKKSSELKNAVGF